SPHSRDRPFPLQQGRVKPADPRADNLRVPSLSVATSERSSMKVVLDIDKLRSQGQITPLEYDRLLRMGRESSGSLGINLLIAFGGMATVGGTLARVHSTIAAIGLGLVLTSAGAVLARRHSRLWGVLGAILAMVGGVLAAGATVMLGKGSLDSYLWA